MRIAVVAAVLFGCVFLSACASTTALESQTTARDAKMARLHFIRPSAIVGVGLSPDIKINGKQIGNLAVGSYFYADRPAGHHQLLLDHEFEPGEFKMEVTARPGEDLYFQVVQGGPPARFVIIGPTVVPVGAPSKEGPFQLVALDAQSGQRLIAQIVR
jgi:hypothetical protein